jgi:hypothetical protein
MSDVKVYPLAKYHKELGSVVVQDAREEKALGNGWFDHPWDAAAGKVGASKGAPPPEVAVAPPHKSFEKEAEEIVPKKEQGSKE